jgi:hypothetical protein
MKLPGIEYKTTPQRLQGPSIQAPLAEANARAAATGAAAGVITGALNKYVQQETQAQVDKESYESAMDIANYVEETDTKINFKISDLPEELMEKYIGEFESADSTIPSHRVLPEMQKLYAEQVVEQRAQNITMPSAKNKFISESKNAIQDNYVKAMLESSRKQKIYNAATAEVRYNQAMKEGKIGVALQIIPTMDLDNNQRKELIEATKTTRETKHYDQQIASQDVVGLQNSLEILELPQETYEEKGGKLPIEKRKQYAKEVRSSIGAINRLGSSKLTAQDKLNNNQALRAIQGITRGHEQDLTKIDNLVEATKERYPVTSHNLAVARSTAHEIKNFFLRQPVTQMWDDLVEMKRKATTTPDGSFIFNLYEEAYREASNKIQNDPMAFATEQGVISPTPIDEQNFGMSLLNLEGKAAVVQEVYGVFNGYLTENQAMEIAGRLEGPARDYFMKEIAVLGDRAINVYNQLADYGIKGPYIVAGEALTEGDKQASDRMLTGSDILADDPTKFKNIALDMEDELVDLSGKTYFGNSKRGSLIEDATNNTYAALVQETRSDPEDFNSKLYAQAFNSVSGGTYKINGAWIEAPSRKVDAYAFKRFLRTRPPSYINRLGDPVGYTDEQVLEGIQDGTYKLESVGKNEYFLFDTTNSRYILDNRSGDSFIFRYEEFSKSKEQIKQEEYVEKYGTEEGEKLYEERQRVAGEEFISPVERIKKKTKDNISF